MLKEVARGPVGVRVESNGEVIVRWSRDVHHIITRSQSIPDGGTTWHFSPVTRDEYLSSRG